MGDEDQRLDYRLPYKTPGKGQHRIMKTQYIALMAANERTTGTLHIGPASVNAHTRDAAFKRFQEYSLQRFPVDDYEEHGDTCIPVLLMV